MKVLTTLVGKDEGTVSIGDLDPVRDFAKVQRLIGVALQDNDLDPAENALSLLQFQGRLFGLTKQRSRERADELVQMFHLEAEANKATSNLSGGNKRRLHCALALVHSPRILFLDEPTVGMDPLARTTFWEVISKLNRNDGVTVLLTTQYLEEADKHASDMGLIIGGEMRYKGTIAGFKSMVAPSSEMSLDESYLKYIKEMSKEEVML